MIRTAAFTDVDGISGQQKLLSRAMSQFEVQGNLGLSFAAYFVLIFKYSFMFLMTSARTVISGLVRKV